MMLIQYGVGTQRQEYRKGEKIELKEGVEFFNLWPKKKLGKDMCPDVSTANHAILQISQFLQKRKVIFEYRFK